MSEPLQWTRIHSTAAQAGSVVVHFAVQSGVTYTDAERRCVMGAEYVNRGPRRKPDVAIALYLGTLRQENAGRPEPLVSQGVASLVIARIHDAFRFLGIDTIDVPNQPAEAES